MWKEWASPEWVFRVLLIQFVTCENVADGLASSLEVDSKGAKLILNFLKDKGDREWLAHCNSQMPLKETESHFQTSVCAGSPGWACPRSRLFWDNSNSACVGLHSGGGGSDALLVNVVSELRALSLKGNHWQTWPPLGTTRYLPCFRWDSRVVTLGSSSSLS